MVELVDERAEDAQAIRQHAGVERPGAQLLRPSLACIASSAQQPYGVYRPPIGPYGAMLVLVHAVGVIVAAVLRLAVLRVEHDHALGGVWAGLAKHEVGRPIRVHRLAAVCRLRGAMDAQAAFISPVAVKDGLVPQGGRGLALGERVFVGNTPLVGEVVRGERVRNQLRLRRRIAELQVVVHEVCQAEQLVETRHASNLEHERLFLRVDPAVFEPFEHGFVDPHVMRDFLERLAPPGQEVLPRGLQPPDHLEGPQVALGAKPECLYQRDARARPL